MLREQEPLASVNAWLLGSVLTLGMTASFAFQYTLGVLAPALTAELGVSRFALGTITAVYYLAAALTSSALGRRVGLVSSRTGMFMLFGFAALGCLLVATVAAAWALFVAGAVSGIGAGLSNPVTNLIIAARPGRRGGLVGAKQAGVQLAAMLVGVGMPVLAAGLGWRGALLVLAGILFLMGLGLVSSIPLGGPYGAARAEQGAKLPPLVRWMCGYAFFMGAGVATLTTYLVLFAHDHIGLSSGTAGLLLATMGLAGALSRILSSVVAERGHRLDAWMMAAAGIAVVGVAVFATTTDSVVVWVGVGLVGISGAAWNGIVMLAVLRISSPGQAGHATGVVLTGFFIGLSVAPPIFGAIVDSSRVYLYGWSFTATCFLVAGVLSVVMSRRHPFPPLEATQMDDAPPPASL
jgi:predicted MFS family arabinose efflux permease